jgi:sirohydrochlorin ferrochelatase
VDIQQAVDRPSAVASRTLGPDTRLTGVLLGRLADAGATTDDVIVLGAAGSTDARARQSVDAAARMLGSAWGSPVPVGYVGGTGTSIDEIVRDVSRSGRRVVVASYLMAPGFFYDRLLGCGADVVTRPVLDGLDVDPDMVSLVLDRFAEAAGALDWASASSSHM